MSKRLKLVSVRLKSDRGVYKNATFATATDVAFLMAKEIAGFDGDTDPSEMDKDTANRLKYCGQILGIEVKDSLIIGKDVSYSFAAAGEKGWDDAETYKIDPESRMLIKEEQPEFCNSGWSKEHNVTKELSKAIQKAYGIDL